MIRSLLAAAGVFASTGAFATESDAAAQEAFIDDARAAISQCSQIHEMDVSAQQQMAAARRAQEQLKESAAAGVQVATIDESAFAIEQKFPRCAEDVRQLLLPRSRGFVSSFADAAAKQQARNMVSQWRTALAAIRSPAASRESEAFERIANRLAAKLR